MSTITATLPSKTTSPSSPIPVSQIHQLHQTALPKRKTMSITQTYFLAHKARAKLSSEAGRPDHNLRLLVGHANLLDSLMLELADAEREQESWFNQSVRVASPSTASAPSAADKTPSRHVQWADTIVEDEEDEDDEDWNADDSDLSSDTSSDDYSEDDDDEEESESSVEEDCEMADATVTTIASTTSLRRVPSRISSSATSAVSVQITPADDDSDVEVDDDEEDYAQLTLTRSPSHSATAPSAAIVPASLPSPTSPPELVMEDSDVSSDEESMPPSPPVVTIGTFTPTQAADEDEDVTSPDQQKQKPTTATKFDDDSSDRLYLPPRNPARLISNICVY